MPIMTLVSKKIINLIYINTYILAHSQTFYITRFQLIRYFTGPISSIFHSQSDKKTIDN